MTFENLSSNVKTAIEGFTNKIKTRFTAVEGRVTTLENKVTTLESVDVIEVVSNKGTASANTMNKLYIEVDGTTADVYYTTQSGNSYSWNKMDDDILDDISLDWSNIQNKPATFEPSTHNHNNIYYTKTEIDNAGYVTASQVSGNIDLTNYVTNTTLNTTLGNYVTDSALNTTLGNYVTDTELSTVLTDYSDTDEIIDMIEYATSQFE